MSNFLSRVQLTCNEVADILAEAHSGLMHQGNDARITPQEVLQSVGEVMKTFIEGYTEIGFEEVTICIED